MGIKLTNMVWDCPDFTGADLILALVLADRADDATGAKLYAGLEWYAKRSRQSSRTVRRQLSRFRDIGWLLVDGGLKGGHGKTTQYRINPEWINNPVKLSGLKQKNPDKVVHLPGQARSLTRTNGATYPDRAVSANPIDSSLSLNNPRKVLKEKTPEEIERDRQKMAAIVESETLLRGLA